jgi:hypothetical protein
MKTTALIFSLLAFIAAPGFANGPMPGDSGMSSNSNTTVTTGGGRQMSGGRDRFSRRRIKHLRQEMDDYRKAQRAADALGYGTGEYLPQMHRNPAERRQYMINRYEFLALKAERGRASAKDIAEMHALQHHLLGN